MAKETVAYEPTDQPIIFQGVALGKFRRKRTIVPGYMQGRRVEIALCWDERTGDLIPEPYQPRRHPLKDGFPIIRLKQAGRLREQMQMRDMTTVRKHGASKQFIDVDPNKERFQIPKPPQSFALKP